MIKKLFGWVWFILFKSSSDLIALRLENYDLLNRLTWASTRIDDLEDELKQKTKELHMFIDALLIDQGRAPLYLTPTALKAEREDLDVLLGRGKEPEVPRPDKLRNAKGARNWTQVASQMETDANHRVNGGV